MHLALAHPPLCLQGCDYIFNCHPKEQLTLKPEQLSKWYMKLLAGAKEKVTRGTGGGTQCMQGEGAAAHVIWFRM